MFAMLGLLAAFALVRTPLDDRVNIETAAYGYADIAKMLSVGGRKVSVASNINQRGAVVGLHSIPFDKAVSALCEALDLRLERVAPDSETYRLVKDPVIEKRDMETRRRFTSFMARGYRSEVGQLAANLERFRSMSVDEVTQQSRAALAAWKPLSAKMQTDSADQETADKIQTLEATIYAAGMKGVPLREITLALAKDAFHLADVADIPKGWHLASLSPVQQAALKAGFQNQERAANNNDSDWLAYGYAYSRSQSSIFLGFQSQYAQGNGVDASGDIPPYSISARGAHSLADVLFAAPAKGAKNVIDLGESARANFTEEVAATKRMQASDQASKAVKIERAKHDLALSEGIELWAKQTGTDVVMPLIPIADSEIAPESETQTLKQLMVPRADWAMADRDGVVVFRDMLSFVDNAFECPVSAALELDKTAKPDPATNLPFAVYRLDDMRKYVRASEGTDFAWRFRGGPAVGSYRGIDTYLLDSGVVPYLAYEAVKRLGVPAIDQDGIRYYSLTSLSNADVAPLVVASQRNVTAVQAFRSDFAEVLRSQTLHVKVSPQGVTGMGLSPATNVVPWLVFGRDGWIRE